MRGARSGKGRYGNEPVYAFIANSFKSIKCVIRRVYDGDDDDEAVQDRWLID
jgi:hypothetical protein